MATRRAPCSTLSNRHNKKKKTRTQPWKRWISLVSADEPSPAAGLRGRQTSFVLKATTRLLPSSRFGGHLPSCCDAHGHHNQTLPRMRDGRHHHHRRSVLVPNGHALPRHPARRLQRRPANDAASAAGERGDGRCADAQRCMCLCLSVCVCVCVCVCVSHSKAPRQRSRSLQEGKTQVCHKDPTPDNATGR